MEITGKLSEILPEQGGQGKTGNAWRKRSFVIETMDTQYPKKVCFDVWGDKIDQLGNIAIGEEMEVSFDVESREFNGKWYTNAKAWKFEKLQAGTSAAAPQGNANPPLPSAGSVPPPPPPPMNEPTDDLPF